MLKKQRGVTLVGWVIILAVIGIFALAAIRLVPVYMESLKVSAVLKSVQGEHDGNRASAAAIRQSVKTRFSVEGINVIRHTDVKVTPIRNGGHQVMAAYEHKTPFIGNLGLIVKVDHRVEINR